MGAATASQRESFLISTFSIGMNGLLLPDHGNDVFLGIIGAGRGLHQQLKIPSQRVCEISGRNQVLHMLASGLDLAPDVSFDLVHLPAFSSPARSSRPADSAVCQSKRPPLRRLAQSGDSESGDGVAIKPQLDHGLSDDDPPIEPSEDSIAGDRIAVCDDGRPDRLLHLLVRQNDIVHCPIDPTIRMSRRFNYAMGDASKVTDRRWPS
jgi:hypothetical protein